MYFRQNGKRLAAAGVAAALLFAGFGTPWRSLSSSLSLDSLTAEAASSITIEDLPSEYQYAADWIWENRIAAESSTVRRNTIFDQIIAGNGTINYVVRWQSYKTVTLEQRQQFETLLSDAINAWNQWLAGYENWPYSYIDVKIVGWAVLDESCLLDLQPDEVVYTNLTDYDSSGDTSNGVDTIPDKLPNAPDELSRMEHFEDASYTYPGGLDSRFDMYMWATQGFPDIGGCGGDWGQRLSDTAYLSMLDGSGLHVLTHELGHGFGMTDFYGEEGASDGFPPGGFPTDNGGSLMMAGSATEITDFDGWMLRYIWTKIKDDEGRFNITETPTVTETTTVTTVTTTETTTTSTTAATIAETTTSTELQTTETNSAEALVTRSFTDVISDCGDGYVEFAEQGRFTYGESTWGEDLSCNLALYETGDKISISMQYWESTGEIVSVDSILLVENSRDIPDIAVLGDVTGDGQCNVADVVAMEQYLLGTRKTLTNWQAGDLLEDQMLNGMDLAKLRSLVLDL